MSEDDAGRKPGQGPPPDVERRWRKKLGDEAYERRVERIRNAEPMFGDAGRGGGDVEGSGEGEGDRHPATDGPTDGRGGAEPPSDGSTPASSGDGGRARATRRLLRAAIWVTAGAVIVLAGWLLLSSVPDIVRPGQSVAQRTASVVQVFSALLGIAAVAVGGALMGHELTRPDGFRARTSAFGWLLGLGLLLLGISGGSAFASMSDDPCDRTCEAPAPTGTESPPETPPAA